MEWRETEKLETHKGLSEMPENWTGEARCVRKPLKSFTIRGSFELLTLLRYIKPEIDPQNWDKLHL